MDPGFAKPFLQRRTDLAASERRKEQAEQHPRQHDVRDDDDDDRQRDADTETSVQEQDEHWRENHADDACDDRRPTPLRLEVRPDVVERDLPVDEVLQLGEQRELRVAERPRSALGDGSAPT